MIEEPPTRDPIAAKSWENEGGSIAVAVFTGRPLLLANIFFVNGTTFNREPPSAAGAILAPKTGKSL
jgi:hypothetical protein